MTLGYWRYDAETVIIAVTETMTSQSVLVADLRHVARESIRAQLGFWGEHSFLVQESRLLIRTSRSSLKAMALLSRRGTHNVSLPCALAHHLSRGVLCAAHYRQACRRASSRARLLLGWTALACRADRVVSGRSAEEGSMSSTRAQPIRRWAVIFRDIRDGTESISFDPNQQAAEELMHDMPELHETLLRGARQQCAIGVRNGTWPAHFQPVRVALIELREVAP